MQNQCTTILVNHRFIYDIDLTFGQEAKKMFTGSPLTKVPKPSPLAPKTASTSVSNDVIDLTSSPAQDYSLPSSTEQAQHTGRVIS